jgi:dihydropyrimidinase
MHDLLIRNGTAVTEAGVREIDIAIDGEVIAAHYPRGTAGIQAAREVDADGKLVLPGGIDPHVHYGIRGSHNTVVSETADNSIAAAYGGNTSVVDFAFHENEPTVHEAVAQRRDNLDGRMAVDYGLHVILTGSPTFEQIDEIADLVRAGYPTFKTIMTYRWFMDDGHRFGVMSAVAEAGGMSLVHAEDDAIMRWLTAKYDREGKTHGAYVTETRGSLVEEAAVRRALLLAERSGSPLYVLHVAAGAAVDALADARARGFPAYGETLAAYLSFTQDDLWDREPITINGTTYPDRGLLYNNYPVPKAATDQAAIWAAIAANRLQVVSSDHFLAKAVDRYTKQGTTIHSMQSGQAAVELRIPVLYTLGVTTGRITLSRFVDLISTNPAKLMGLYPRKGTLAVGSDADVLIFDQNFRRRVRVEDLHMDTDYSCWAGWDLTGIADTVLLRGRPLIEAQESTGPRGGGRFVEREILPTYLRQPVGL